MNTYILHITRPLLTMVLLGAIVGCAKDSDTDAPIVFPEKQVIDANVGDKKPLSFNAPADHWELISEQPVWCRLSYGEQNALPSVVGEAGQVTVTISVSDDMSSFITKSTADLTLRIGNQEQVIGTVVRSDIDTWVIVRQNGEIVPQGGEIVIDASGETDIDIETNFGAPDIQHSEWFDVNAADGAYTIALADGVSVKYPKTADEGYIDFTLLQSRAIGNHQYKVSFAGMDPAAMRFRGYLYHPEDLDVEYALPAFNWEVTPDGKTICTTRANGDIVRVQDVMTVTVDALNDDIVFATLNADDCFEPLTGDEWYHVTQDKSRVSISVDAMPAAMASREASIYAFSRAQWIEVEPEIIRDDEEYSNHVIFSFVQKIESVGFEVTYYNWQTYTMGTLPVTQETTPSTLNLIRQYEPSARDIYRVSTAEIPANIYSGTKSLTANMLLANDEWTAGASVRNYALIDLSTGEDVMDKKNYAIDPGMDIGGNWQFDILFPASQTYPLLLVVYDKDGNGEVLKALVIDN